MIRKIICKIFGHKWEYLNGDWSVHECLRCSLIRYPIIHEAEPPTTGIYGGIDRSTTHFARCGTIQQQNINRQQQEDICDACKGYPPEFIRIRRKVGTDDGKL